jgi:tetraacyldisaccharide 4'-kinase
LEQRWQAWVEGGGGTGGYLMRPLLSGLAGLYGLGLAANHAVYRTGLKQPSRAALPVLSVGNLSLGGTGKSTAVRWLARALLALGQRPGIVLRGHGRQGGEAVVLASEGRGLLAPLAEIGDEAAEFVAALPGVAVGVGKRRERVIERLAAAGFTLALLDDGLQYFRMARDLNLVLLDATMSAAGARLFPRGTLREPWSALQRADQVWLTHVDLAPAEQLAWLRSQVARYHPGIAVIETRHAPADLRHIRQGPQALAELAGRKVIALSALGNPVSFEAALQALGAEVIPLRFPDHHHYTAADWQRVEQLQTNHGTPWVVTTEKDAVKLGEWALDLWVLRSEIEIVGGGDAVQSALQGILA